MKKRQYIVAGNWKMNKTYEEGRDLAKDIVERLQPSPVLAVLATPFIHLNSISNIIKGVSNLKLAAQNCHQEESGAYTGEVSAGMLQSVGVEYVLIGHSERREYFQESDELLAKKVNAVLNKKLVPIFCCGEKLEVREADQHLELVAHQLKNALFHLSSEQFSKVVIAYEPVWAIGTGKTASPAQAQEMHLHIRNLLARQYGEEAAQTSTILYGGSVNPANAKELFQQPDVDGGLVGGASLKAEDFVTIVNSF
jgi:triosephosphate isomerase